MNARITSLFYQILVVAGILWFFGYAYYTVFLQIAEKIQFDLKTKYLRSLLEQEFAYFEENSASDVAYDIDWYFSQITNGIGSAVGQLLQASGCCVGGLAIALWKGPIFFLISAIYIPFMLIIVMFVGYMPKAAMFKKMQASNELA